VELELGRFGASRIGIGIGLQRREIHLVAGAALASRFFLFAATSMARAFEQFCEQQAHYH